MYALWLDKEIKTEYGYCKLEIFRKGVFDYIREIDALGVDSLSLSLENMSSITDPIGKSVCSFSIIDTGQINYEDFFTPDATAFKVVVSTKVGEGAYVTRWSGFITPDFFAENLTYRTPISISARDNIGYLADVDFDLTARTITVRELITSAFARISDDYPMSLVFATQKQTAEGVLAIDATISTALLREMTWYEALEAVLHDLGLQMRWVDNNAIAVIDVSQIPEYYATQGFNFIGASGYREILPAWRELGQNQDFGLRENFFEGEITPQNMTFAREQVIQANGPIFNGLYSTTIRYYTPNNWDRAGEMYTINPADFFNGGQYKGRIFFTGIQSNIVNYSMNFMSWRQPILQSNWPMLVKFNAYNAIMAPDPTFGSSLQNLVLYADSEDRYQLGLKVNVLLHSGSKTYILRQNWEELNGSEHTAIEFILSELTHNGTPQEEELSIEINSIPHDGELELRIYGFFLNPKYDENIAIAEGTAIKMVSYISDVAYTYDTNAIPTGQDSGVTINEQHNVKSTDDYTFGQVPYRSGGINAFAGGLFKEDGNELIGFQRNAEGENYNLLELVGREVIHFNKKNYNKLSGTIMNLDKEPLMFNKLFVREGKTYAPFAYSLNVISNQMNITTMQEVEPYETASFTQIESEVTTGGATVGGGNNTVLQYSEKPGNVKRVYELTTATGEEKNDGYLILDSPSFGEAKKVHISEVKDAELRDDFNALEKEVEAITSMLGDDTEGVIDTWNEVVDFLEGYKESEDLATILSGINAAIADRALKTDLTALATTVGGLADTLATEQGYIDTLQGYFVNGVAKKATADALGNVITDTYATKVALNAVDERVKTLEALGLTLEVRDGVTYVKSKYSFYTMGGLASGEPSSSGGGGGTVGGSNVSFKAELLSGTKIGTITIDNVATNIYAPSALANPYALTFGSKTYDGSAAKTITAADLGALTAHQDISHLLSKTAAAETYLPLSGGTIEGRSGIYTPLRIKNTSLPEVWIGFQDSVGTCHIGSSNGVPSIYTGDSNRTLIHSGNIGSQSVNYATSAGNADTLDGFHADTMVKSYIDSTSNLTRFTNRAFFQTAWISEQGDFGALVIPTWASNSTDTFYTTELRFDLNNANPKIRITNPGGTSGWYILARTVDNVASATKLQTARTIWGQSFDGTDNIIGDLSILSTNSALNLLNGSVSGNASLTLNTEGASFARIQTSHYGVAYTCPLLLNPNGGNVLIGTTTDYGEKLQVAELFRILPNVGGFSGMHFTMNSSTKAGYHLSARGGEAAKHFRLYYTSDNSLFTALVDITPSGNVLIGTTSGSSDAKLYVAGNFEATGGVASRQPSDRRLKENICTISTTDAVSVLRRLNPIFFKWNALATSLDSRNTGDSVGFIADEYESLIVNSGRDIWEKYRAIDYTKAIPYLAKGWQIHDTILVKHADNIENLLSRVEVLERENRELKQRLNMRA